MKLKEFRRARKLTQEEVADFLGIPMKTYQNYEREVREPDSEVLCKLADFYGTTLDALIGRTPDRSDIENMLLTMFRSMDAKGQDRLLEIADDMVRSGKYVKKEVQDYPIQQAAIA